MLRPDQDDYAEEAGLQELIEQFEGYYLTREYSYFDEEALERIYEYYEARMEEGKMEAVADLAIEQNPYSADFLTRKAELLFNRKAFQEALSLLDKAVVFDATHIDIYLLKSDILLELNQAEEATATLMHALQLADKEEKDIVLAELSDIAELGEDFMAAFRYLEQALSINPGNETVLMKFAHIVEMTDQFDESLTIHQQITDAHPYNWMAWYNMGKAYAGTGNYHKALEAFEFTMAIQEDFDLVYRDAADIYFRLEEYDKAIETFQVAQEKSGGFEDHSFRIGLCYEKKQDLKKARFHYRKSTRHDPYLDEAFFRIGESYRQENRLEPALVNYKKALRIDNDNEFYIACIISVYRMMGREEEVGQYLQQLVNSRPDILNYWLDLIVYLLEQQEPQRAFEAVENAMLRCGNFVEFTYLQSLICWQLGKHQAVRHLLGKALEEDYSRHIILNETDPSFLSIKENADLLDLYRK